MMIKTKCYEPFYGKKTNKLFGQPNNLHAPVIMNETAIRADFFMFQRTIRNFTTCFKDLFDMSLG